MTRHRARRDRPRKTTLPIKKITRTELRAGALMYPPVEDVERPRTWGECREALADGPCPWVSCKHHLYLDVTSTGSITLNFPDLEPWELNFTCSLELAEYGAQTLEFVGVRMNLTRERIRHLEVIGLAKLKTWIENQRAREEQGVAA